VGIAKNHYGTPPDLSSSNIKLRLNNALGMPGGSKESVSVTSHKAIDPDSDGAPERKTQQAENSLSPRKVREKRDKGVYPASNITR
jgi:hypothetical protein